MKDKVINDLLSRIAKLEYEVERLNNIIKEVREYTEEMQVWDYEYRDFVVLSKGLLEILDKGE